MLPQPVFPSEVFDIILGFIPYSIKADSDSDVRSATTLLNCSLVSFSFRDKAQKRLFEEVIIEFPIFDAGYITADKALISSARLRSYVKNLEIYLSLDMKYRPHIFEPSFPHLIELSICARAGETFQWARLVGGETCIEDIFTLLLMPSLRILKFVNIMRFPVALLKSPVQLKELILDHSLPDENSRVEGPSPATPNYLDTLHFDGETFFRFMPTLNRLASSFSIARLRRMSLTIMDASTCVALNMILEEARAYLEHLELTFHPRLPLSWDLLNIPNILALRKLSFFPKRTIDVSRIVSFLEEIPEANKLGVVHISGQFREEDDEYWKLLDDVLSRDKHAAHFQRLVLRQIDHFPSGRSGSDLETDLQTLLPCLHASHRVFLQGG